MKTISFLTALVIILILGAAPSYNLCYGKDVTFQWDSNTEPDLAGYKLYYKTGASGPPYDGTGADQGDSPIDVDNVTTFTIEGLSGDDTYFFVVTAYDTEGLESDYSNEVTTTPGDGRSAVSSGSSSDGGCAMSSTEGNLKDSLFYLAMFFSIQWFLRRKRAIKTYT